MTVDRLVAALALPPEARVDQRVPKKLLTEHGSPTVADKRRIQEGIEEVRWFAALKPGNVGVPAYRDEVREYPEIAVLVVTIRTPGQSARLTELIHRAIPYPVVLAASMGEEIVLSLAHKRFSQGEGGAFVLDGEVVASPGLGGVSDSEPEGERGASAPCPDPARQGADAFRSPRRTAPENRPPSATPPEPDALFLQALPLASQPRVHLCALYQGWIDLVEALQAARLTGRFVPAPSAEAAAARRAALAEHEDIRKEIATLRARAQKETQIAHRVDMNLTIRRLEDNLARAASKL